MTIKFRPSIITSLFLATVFISGCKKVVHEDIRAASNSSVALMAYNDVFEQVKLALSFGEDLDQVQEATWFMPASLHATATVTPLGTAFPKTLTIDFGNGAIGMDGVNRSGKIVATFDGPFGSEGASAEVLFVNYTTGQYTLAGTYKFTNNGTGSGKPTYAETVTNGVISWGTQQVLWDADLTRKWTEGETTDLTTDSIALTGLTDDVFELTGTAEGNDANTHPFTLEVTSSVKLPSNCNYITEGMLDVSPANFNTGSVDYGTGECDIQATIEVDGEVFNFTL